MQTFKIFVVGPFSSGKTTFIQAISEFGVVSTEGPHLSKEERAASPIPAMDFGRLTLHEDLVLYLFGHPANHRMERTFEYLGLLSETGFVLVLDSANLDIDHESAHFRHYIQNFNRPYVVALSKRGRPNARTPQQMREILNIRNDIKVLSYDERTPQQMREILNIPDDIKVLSYDWKDAKSAKQVVLELVELFPRDELVQRVIDGLKAKIEESAS